MADILNSLYSGKVHSPTLSFIPIRRFLETSLNSDSKRSLFRCIEKDKASGHNYKTGCENRMID